MSGVISLTVGVINGEIHSFLLNTDDHHGGNLGFMIYVSKHTLDIITIYIRVVFCLASAYYKKS